MSHRQVGVAGVVALLVGLALTTTVPAAVRSTRADAAGLHRAGVIVDPGDGSGPHTACVWFEEESISGLELLARSSFDAGVRAFGGLGGAVCSIDGAGCSSDSACLTCGGTQYWAYATADPSDVSFAQAPAGAGSRTVTDGAIDGWRWGSGDPPVFRSIDRICPASPPPEPTTPRPAPAPPPAAAPAPPPGGPQVRGLPNDLPQQPATDPAPTATTAVTTTTSTTSTTVPRSTVLTTTSTSTTVATTSTTMIGSDGEPAATVAAAVVPDAENDADGGGTGALAIVAVAIAVGLGGTAVWRLRRGP